MATRADSLEPICDLRFGQVGIANLRLLQNDPTGVEAELAHKVESAPALFARTALVLDLSHLDTLPDDTQARALLDAVLSAGMLPVGLAYGTSATGELASRLGLPVIAKFRAAYEHDTRPAPRAPAPAAAAPTVPTTTTSLHHAQPVRSGQQVYAQGRGLVVAAAVAAGAEVIADGSIHVYGRLSGRALAGALGNEQARIYCTDFRAQLVSIAGHYRVFEEVPADLDGHAVQCWLDGDKLMLARL
ncbi:MAG TPA: septum site-determining protein MinC [Rhodanobacteraceae bacterium]|nr:septum site-determining protein MinC [Rhodanobacteraceae bacterium]